MQNAHGVPPRSPPRTGGPFLLHCFGCSSCLTSGSGSDRHHQRLFQWPRATQRLAIQSLPHFMWPGDLPRSVHFYGSVAAFMRLAPGPSNSACAGALAHQTAASACHRTCGRGIRRSSTVDVGPATRHKTTAAQHRLQKTPNSPLLSDTGGGGGRRLNGPPWEFG